MATHIGPAFEGSQFVSGVPLDIIMKGALMKDAKIEQNITQFKDEFRTIASQPIENEESAKYIKEKLGQAVENVKNFVNQGGIDFSQQESMSSLRSSVNDVISDPEFMRRYKNDIEASGKRRQVETLKQIGSDKFSNENYAVFMKHYQDYVKDPNGSRMDYSYVEYDNYNERLNSAIKDLKPETRIRQVVRKVNGMDVIENVTEKFYDPNRVQQVITNTLGDKGIAQLRTNYDYQMMTSTDDYVKEYFTSNKNLITGHIDNLIKEKNNYLNMKSDKLTPEEAKFIGDYIAKIDERIELESGPLAKMDEIINGYDGSEDYYKKHFDFSTYFSNRMKGMVSQHAIIEDIKKEIDPLSMEALKWYYKAQEMDLKFNYDLKSAEHKNTLDMILEKTKAMYNGKTGSFGGGVAGDGTTKFDSPNRSQDEFRDAFVNYMFSENGEYQMPVDIVGYSLSGGQKPNSDGTYNVSISKDNAFTTIGDVDHSAFGNVTPERVTELTSSQKYEEAYEKWYSKTYPIRSGLDYVRPGNAISRLRGESLNTGVTGSILNSNPLTRGFAISDALSSANDVKESRKEFENSQEFKNLGLDKNFKYNPNWENDYRKGTSFKNTKSVDMLISNKFADLGHGKFNVSSEKGNMIRSNNGFNYAKGYTTVSRAHLESIGFDEDVFKDFEEAGILRRTSAADRKEGNSNANDQYQLKLYVQVPTDVAIARDMYYRDKLGDKAFEKLNEKSNLEFTNTWNTIGNIAKFRNLPGEEMYSKTQNIKRNIDKLIGDVITKEQGETAKENIETLINTFGNKSANIWSRMDAGQTLTKLALAENENDLEKLKEFISNATGGVKYSSTVAKGTPLTVEEINKNLSEKPTMVSDSGSYVVTEPISVQYNFGPNHRFIAGLLDAIAVSEGGEYDIAYTGIKFKGFAEHPGMQFARPTSDGKMSSASGKYQFTSTTWQTEVLPNNSDIQDFSPASQDKAAWWYLNKLGIVNEEKLVQASHTGYLNISKEKIFPIWRGTEDSKDKFLRTFKAKTGITLNLV